VTACFQSPHAAVLFRFDPTGPFAAWQAVDDPTMGGHSRSALVPTDSGTACFTGAVSLANGGGFCSVRSPDFTPLPDATAVALRVRGDGKTYKVCLHTRYMLPGTSYRASFDTCDSVHGPASPPPTPPASPPFRSSSPTDRRGRSPWSWPTSGWYTRHRVV
jgi:Complex I intermediate-associated protein 30 (CIA30)